MMTGTDPEIDPYLVGAIARRIQGGVTFEEAIEGVSAVAGIDKQGLRLLVDNVLEKGLTY